MKKLFIILSLLYTAIVATGQTAEDSIAIVNTKWTTTIIGKGVVHKHAQFTKLYGVTQNINIIEIDTKNGYKTGIATGNPNNITSELAKSNQALAAINGSYFDIKKGNSVCYFQIGKEVIDTTTNSEFDMRVTGAIVVKKGKMTLIPWDKDIEQNHKIKNQTILASGPLMLNKGQSCNFTSCSEKFITTKHPRTAIATTRDKRIIMVTVDGRFPGKAEGINIPELTHLLRVLGGEYALNLDGGGSTTMWHQKASENGVVNRPYDNKIFDNYGERKVANIVYIYK